MSSTEATSKSKSLFETIIGPLDWKGSVKVFLIILILGVLFFVFYIMIKPDHSPPINLLAFPSSGPYVPTDNSICGRNVINCTENNSLCATDQGCASANYECTPIPANKEVYYLGTRLQPGQSFCLPQQSAASIGSCGTYTGKALWNLDHWICQCKYPSLFSGQDCNDQVACTTGNSRAKLKKYDENGNKIIPEILWDTTQVMSATASRDNPLDVYANGAAMYKCDCGEQQYYNAEGDEYRCHENICLAGVPYTTSLTAIPFTNNQCQCDNINTTKSNVTGFCYPVNSSTTSNSNCYPDPTTGNCSCGNVFIDADTDSGGKITKRYGYFFKYGSDIYITYQPANDCISDVSGVISCPIYKVNINNYINISGYNSVIQDIKGTLAEFSFMQYPSKVMDPNEISFSQYIESSYARATYSKEKINNVVATNPTNSVAIPCDSYFYNRTHDYGCPTTGCVKCSDPYYASGDQNNKTGTMCFNPVANQTCGGHDATAVINVFDPEGYSCTCSTDSQSYAAPDIPITSGSAAGHVQHVCGWCKVAAGKTCRQDSDCMPCTHCTGGECKNSSCVVM